MCRSAGVSCAASRRSSWRRLAWSGPLARSSCYWSACGKGSRNRFRSTSTTSRRLPCWSRAKEHRLSPRPHVGTADGGRRRHWKGARRRACRAGRKRVRDVRAPRPQGTRAPDRLRPRPRRRPLERYCGPRAETRRRACARSGARRRARPPYRQPARTARHDVQDRRTDRRHVGVDDTAGLHDA